MDRQIRYLKEGVEYESWLNDEGLENRFFLKTRERKIIFLFRNGSDRPGAVIKCGKTSQIEREYINQKNALALFPTNVPEIYFLKSDGDVSDLCMEYVNGLHLNTIVSSAWMGRKKKYLGELKEIFGFLLNILKLVPARKEKVSNIYPWSEIETIMRIVYGHFGRKAEIDDLGKMLKGVDQIESALVMQHRDFCVANVLYGDKGRKVIIDWEDSREKDLIMVDFNMLLISVAKVYEETLGEAREQCFKDREIMENVNQVREEIRGYFGLEKSCFRKISLLSTLSLCSQNLQKQRFKTADEIFSFLIREAR